MTEQQIKEGQDLHRKIHRVKIEILLINDWIEDMYKICEGHTKGVEPLPKRYGYFKSYTHQSENEYVSINVMPELFVKALEEQLRVLNTKLEELENSFNKL